MKLAVSPGLREVSLITPDLYVIILPSTNAESTTINLVEGDQSLASVRTKSALISPVLITVPIISSLSGNTFTFGSPTSSTFGPGGSSC